MTALQLPVGVHVFERGWLSSNNILFDDGVSSWLVDSGYATHAAQTLELVESRLGSRALNFLINTHLHSDHCGGNSALQSQYSELQTIIPPGDAHLVTHWDTAGLSFERTGQQCSRFSFDFALQPGSELQLGLQVWEVHGAGGHDPNAVVFFEPVSKVLISGDALWENGFGVVFPELDGINAFCDVEATLNLIAQLNPHTIIPGHGPVFEYSNAVLAIARQKLNAFATDPVKHARHAGKVLLKFKLLELQSILFSDFLEWAEGTALLKISQQQFFGSSDFYSWFEQACSELVQSGVAKLEGEYILNS